VFFDREGHGKDRRGEDEGAEEKTIRFVREAIGFLKDVVYERLEKYRKNKTEAARTRLCSKRRFRDRTFAPRFFGDLRANTNV
jgi:hypothetical protein